jgi:hypothetical protein
MESVAKDLLSMLSKAVSTLRDISEATASVRPAPGKWSKKEILGHLIDSAVNNHQRFVRLQMASLLELPGYEQDRWVQLGHYQDRPWTDIIDLWLDLNTHLVTVIRHIDPSCLENIWRTPAGKEFELGFIARDYLDHMQHHLDQILKS